ncbi:acyl-CoA dehydrogenase family protein [Spirillospora sp. NPDC047279]|uniref:acyl-CoA dehydrogenase family protein n=1 Tax=Spirillospora sp. NPDC047279 TaxID=3155478 RepID=UPI0033DABE24
MDFSFTDEQDALVAKVRAFVTDRVAPAAAEHDRTGVLPPEFLRELADADLFALSIPRRFGGLGLDAVSTGAALEELARGEPAACHPVQNAALIGGIIAANCDEERQADWLPPIARGESIVALCLTEPRHGTDAAAIGLTATPDPDGGDWRLDGTKTSIMAGAYATHGLVFARTGGDRTRGGAASGGAGGRPPSGGGARGVTAFFTPLDEPGVTRERLSDLGHRAGGRATLEFNGLRVGPENVVGDVGAGFVEVMRGFGYSRALIALTALASASASLDDAIGYARERTAFGEPIGRFQGVAFPLAEHATYLKAARMLAYEALWRKDQGLDHRLEANMAKGWAPKAAVDAHHQALLTFGHFGWSTGNPVERRLRDGIGLEIADGTANATKLVVARHLLGREHAP